MVDIKDYFIMNFNEIVHILFWSLIQTLILLILKMQILMYLLMIMLIIILLILITMIMILRTYYQKNYGLKFKNLYILQSILKRSMRLIILTCYSTLGWIKTCEEYDG